MAQSIDKQLRVLKETTSTMFWHRVALEGFILQMKIR